MWLNLIKNEKFFRQKTNENCQQPAGPGRRPIRLSLSGWRSGRPYQRTGDGELFGSCASNGGPRRVWEVVDGKRSIGEAGTCAIRRSRRLLTTALSTSVLRRSSNGCISSISRCSKLDNVTSHLAFWLTFPVVCHLLLLTI
jgi:hypothetical protein